MQRVTFQTAVAVAICSIRLLAADYTWTGLGADAKASTGGNWDLGSAPSSGDAVVFDATGRDHPCTWDLDVPLASWTQDGYTNVVTIQTVYSDAGFDCLEIAGDVLLNSGVWTHPANSSAETYRLRVDVGGDMTIGQDAAINLTKKGYAAGKGPGYPGGHTGAAHGGQADASGNGVNSLCYGSIASPIRLGSGGEKYESQGGGALRLTVAGSLTHAGAIEADGRTYLANGTLGTYYGAAGGSVWITAGSLSGAGLVSASSGRQNNNYHGGGGRVSLVLTDANADFSAFTGEVKATSTYNGGYKANSGTVYYETAADGAGHGKVVVDGYGTSVSGSYTDIILDDQDASFAPRRIELGNVARVRIRPGTRKALSLSEGIFGFGTGAASVVLDEGAELVGGALKIDKASLSLLGGNTVTCSSLLATNGANIIVSGAATVDSALLEIATGGTLTDNAPLTVTGSVAVRSGGVITHSANTATSDYRVQLSAGGSLTVDAGGKVTAESKGFPANAGPGKGAGASRGSNHGGVGVNNNGLANTGVCYGSLTRPVSFGSGTSGGAGGGAIAISCAGPVTNNGVIASCGTYSSTTKYLSTGGSVWLTAASLAGSGYIQANAYGDSTQAARGNAAASANRSGGGRVAVWLTAPDADFSDFSGTISAWGAGSTGILGGAGTVYLKTGNQGANEGTLVIDNRYNATTVGNTEIGADVSDTEVGSVVIGLGARVLVKDGQTLTVNGDFAITNTTGNTFTMEAGSSLALAGSRPATLSNSLSVPNLICQAPGKAISFADGITVSVSERLSLEGAAGSPVSLGPAGGAGTWNLALAEGADQVVSYVTVAGSDASGGQEIVAMNSTGTDTVNWRFENISAGETITWTGADSSSWVSTANWDLGRAPIATDVVVIPATAHQPELAADTVCAELEIASGATLSLGGFNLAVDGDASVAGALVASGSETLAFGGDLDLSQGSLTAAASTVVLNGSEAQAFAAGGNAFHSLTFANTSPDGIAVSGVPTARNVVCAPAVATALSFADGASLSVAVSLSLSGASPGVPLSLLPAAAGGAWRLHSLGIADISNVAVSNSTASANTLVASGSRDLGGNTGWVFGADNATTWTGAVDGDWSTAGNWSAGVPDAATAVTIGSGADVSIASAAAARSLRVDGATLTVGAPLAVAEALVAGDGATVVMDKPVTVGTSAILLSGATVTHGDLGTAGVGGIDLAVDGDLVVEAGAAISAKGKSASALGRSTQSRGSAAHGGRASNSSQNNFNPCYGSVYFPTNAGTISSFDYSNLLGGGIVRLRVGGALTVDGTIDAEGEDGSVGYYSGSGGSVWITAGSLGGSGAVSAMGGSGGSFPGAGGRVAVYLTDDGASLGASPSVTAYGGSVFSEGTRISKGSPGTVYIETAADKPGCGLVRVANHPSAPSGNYYVDYPSTLRAAAGDGQDATWRLSGYGYLYVTRDAKVRDIWLEGSKPRIYLNGHTLRVRSFPHALGADESVQVIPGGTAENPGRIIWNVATTLFVR